MKMNKEKVVWGVVLLGAGAVLLLHNLGLINFYWSSVFRLWPVIIILIGFNMLIPRTRAGNVASVLVTTIVVGFLAYAGTQNLRYNWGEGNKQGSSRWFDLDFERGSVQIKRLFRNELTHHYNDRIHEASLSIQGGAIEYDIEEPTSEYLFWSETKSVVGPHYLEVNEKADGTKAEIRFQLKESQIRNWNLKNDKNEANIRLHPDPIWSIKLEMGAGTADLDLRKYKLSKLDIECGAAAVEAKLGHPVGHTQVNVESGAASVKIEVPHSAACRIEVSSALSSRDFKGFTKQSDGSFTTPGYDEATDRYTIRLQGGASSFTVEREDD